MKNKVDIVEAKILYGRTVTFNHDATIRNVMTDPLRPQYPILTNKAVGTVS